MSRARDLQLGFADLEFLRQGVVLERELQSIIDFLDEHEEMVEAVGAKPSRCRSTMRFSGRSIG